MTAAIHACGQAYKHKTEAELASMTPTQRVDEWVIEQVHHRFDLSDDHYSLIKRYVLRDGIRALPRLIEIMDDYDSTRFREGKGRRGERFDASLLMFINIDRQAIRLRASAEGQRAMSALEHAIERMRRAGYERRQQHEWKWVPDGRFEMARDYLQETNGINDADEIIRNTFRSEYQIQLADEELLRFSNFLVARCPDYPSWSERDFIQMTGDRKPGPGLIMKERQRFYEAYLEFKQTKR